MAAREAESEETSPIARIQKRGEPVPRLVVGLPDSVLLILAKQRHTYLLGAAWHRLALYRLASIVIAATTHFPFDGLCLLYVYQLRPIYFSRSSNRIQEENRCYLAIGCRILPLSNQHQ